MIELSLITCVNYISAYSGGRCKQLCFHGTNKCCLKHIWELNIPDLVGFFFFFFFFYITARHLKQEKTGQDRLFLRYPLDVQSSTK